MSRLSIEKCNSPQWGATALWIHRLRPWVQFQSTYGSCQGVFSLHHRNSLRRLVGEERWLVLVCSIRWCSIEAGSNKGSLPANDQMPYYIRWHELFEQPVAATDADSNISGILLNRIYPLTKLDLMLDTRFWVVCSPKVASTSMRLETRTVSQATTWCVTHFFRFSVYRTTTCRIVSHRRRGRNKAVFSQLII